MITAAGRSEQPGADPVRVQEGVEDPLGRMAEMLLDPNLDRRVHRPLQPGVW